MVLDDEFGRTRHVAAGALVVDRVLTWLRATVHRQLGGRVLPLYHLAMLLQIMLIVTMTLNAYFEPTKIQLLEKMVGAVGQPVLLLLFGCKCQMSACGGTSCTA